jgi:hypothetical protein
MVASDMALEVIGDFAIVWLLSPRKNFSPRAASALSRAIAGLPAHCLQVCTVSRRVPSSLWVWSAVFRAENHHHNHSYYDNHRNNHDYRNDVMMMKTIMMMMVVVVVVMMVMTTMI